MDTQHEQMSTPESTLAEPVDTFGIHAPDHRVERAISAQTLRAAASDLLRGGDTDTTRIEIAAWLRQRAHTITHEQWSR